MASSEASGRDLPPSGPEVTHEPAGAQPPGDQAGAGDPAASGGPSAPAEEEAPADTARALGAEAPQAPSDATQRREGADPAPAPIPGQPAWLAARLVAAAIDLALVALVAALPGAGLFALLVEARGPWGVDALSAVGIAVATLGLVTLPLVVLVGMEAWGRSPGRWLVGIAVVLGNGHRPGPRRGAARAFARVGGLALWPFGPWVAVGVLVLVHGAVLLHPQGRGLHDRLAGTIVVRR
ncbi:RDD family protein [Egibacter rhizosphaerae]|nr:RDD family protein [Egibacter rhizosphaerae]